MEIEPVVASAIIFSDAVIRDQTTGKLTLIGVFHRFKCLQIPFKSPSFFVTVFVTNMNGRIENLPVTMKIEDAKGRIISTAEGHITATSAVDRKDFAEVAFPVPPTVFEQEGHFKAVVLVNGEVLGHRTFFVQSVKEH